MSAVPPRLHVLGVCGTFMGGLARLARDLGWTVSGSDAGAYPPMSTQLAGAGIRVQEGYAPEHLEPAPDLVAVGNAMTRGNPAVEHALDAGLALVSGPEWLARHVLPGRHVLAVAGTHGKTSTASMLAWILERAGMEPGFLIGGVPGNFDVSARLGRPGGCFVVEADEYDAAFFDKRSKFVHYRPRTLAITNIEYDHADIFPDLAAIVRQFHHLVRTVPGTGRILAPAGDSTVDRVLACGCWTPVERFGEDAGAWRVALRRPDASCLEIRRDGAGAAGTVRWPIIGRHNALNALAAVAAAGAAGVDVGVACAALADFRPARRRLELRGTAGGVAVYDDFAHHPTAVRATLQALRAAGGDGRLLAVLDPASNTMRMGVHRDTLGPALDGADRAWVFAAPRLAWDATRLADPGGRIRVVPDVAEIVEQVAGEARPGDRVVVMSNAGFEGLHARLLARLGDAVRSEPA